MAKSKSENQLPSLSQFINVEDTVLINYSPEQMLDKPFILTDVQFSENNFGPFAILHGTFEDSGKHFIITTGAEPIYKPLAVADGKIEFPCNAMIYKYGKSYAIR